MHLKEIFKSKRDRGIIQEHVSQQPPALPALKQAACCRPLTSERKGGK